MSQIVVSTKAKDEVIDITDRINEALASSKTEDGICNLLATHTTCALSIADLDPGTDQDYLHAFREMVPKIKYNHPHDPSHMGDHILSTLIGPSLSLPYENKQLQLGTWQRAVLLEFDGPRERTILVTLS